jgi:Lrp/AsnC family leucine-responsive transcriptional regulator
LRTSGAIRGEVALVDPALAGIEIIVAVSMRDEDKQVYDRLKRRLGAAPEVSQCYSVTGEVDLILHVHMRDMAHYEDWIDTNILAENAVRRCTSHVVYSRIKYSTAIPL